MGRLRDEHDQSALYEIRNVLDKSALYTAFARYCIVETSVLIRLTCAYASPARAMNKRATTRVAPTDKTKEKRLLVHIFYIIHDLQGVVCQVCTRVRCLSVSPILVPLSQADG